MIPSKDKLTICFAHVAYQLQQRFSARNTGITSFEVRDRAALERRVREADVLVISGLWQNDLLDRATRLASSSRSAREPISFRARRWRSAASASRPPAA